MTTERRLVAMGHRPKRNGFWYVAVKGMPTRQGPSPRIATAVRTGPLEHPGEQHPLDFAASILADSLEQWEANPW